jgi:hypothetical protein
MGFHRAVTLAEALERTIAWERANPPEPPAAVGILDDDGEGTTR